MRSSSPSTAVPPSVGFAFGPNRLWIDRVATASQAERWLEIMTDDPAAAAAHLQEVDVVRCDADSPSFWTSSPAQVVHLVGPDRAGG